MKKFADIKLEKPGSDDLFLKLLKDKIDPSFEKEVLEIKKLENNSKPKDGRGKWHREVNYKFKVVRKKRILEMELVKNKKQVNHVWLSLKGVETFFGYRKTVNLKKMDFLIAPALRNFISKGTVDEDIFVRITGDRIDDWPKTHPI